MTSPDPADDPRAALVGELARRTGVCWVRHDGRTHPVWHVWCDDALCVVSGGTEQPFPDVEDGGLVDVVMRSKDTGGRLLTWVGHRGTRRRAAQRAGPVDRRRRLGRAQHGATDRAHRHLPLTRRVWLRGRR